MHSISLNIRQTVEILPKVFYNFKTTFKPYLARSDALTLSLQTGRQGMSEQVA
jgi:hypothetical protein